ncbi:MAG: DUF2934 domain-containing protein [Terriglobales bacterium]
MTQLRLSPPPSVEEQSRGFMTEHSKREDQVRRPEPLTDFCREDRHELVQKLAYQHWEERGRPPGSPEIDWFAAEKAVRSYLLASGIELGPDEGLY